MGFAMGPQLMVAVLLPGSYGHYASFKSFGRELAWPISRLFGVVAAVKINSYAKIVLYEASLRRICATVQGFRGMGVNSKLTSVICNPGWTI